MKYIAKNSEQIEQYFTFGFIVLVFCFAEVEWWNTYPFSLSAWCAGNPAMFVRARTNRFQISLGRQRSNDSFTQVKL